MSECNGRITRRAFVLVMVLVGLITGGGSAGLARGQASAIDCSTAATPAASPSAGAATAATPLAATAAEFPAGGGQLTVFAAASLTDAFGKMKMDLEAAHPGLAITYNFAGSQALVTQLQQGAKADVFASANTAQMKAAQGNGSIAGAPVTFVRNKLAIVTPAADPAGISSPADLAKPGLKLVLAQPEVPVGRYARESICEMGADAATYGAGFVEKVAANVVSEEEDVREVLTKVQLGEADAGIVYVSDANVAKEKVRLIEIPPAVNAIATYPIAAVVGGNRELADAFVAYVLSPEGQRTLADYGFEPVTP